MNNIFSQSFLVEIKDLALKIALRQRNEHHMQAAKALHHKFKAEMQELAEASEQWDELPDITYYAACLVIVRDELAPRPPYDLDCDDPYYDESQQAAECYEEEDAKQWTQDALSQLSSECERRGVSIAQIEAGTLAKYRLRAVQAKDIDAERAAILDAVDPTKHGIQLHAVTIDLSRGSESDYTCLPVGAFPLFNKARVAQGLQPLQDNVLWKGPLNPGYYGNEWELHSHWEPGRHA